MEWKLFLIHDMGIVFKHECQTGMNNKIVRSHEATLIITCDHKSSSFRELLNKDNIPALCQWKIRALTIKRCKVTQRLCILQLLNEVLLPYEYKSDLHGKKFLQIQRVESVRDCHDSISFRATITWGILLNETTKYKTPKLFSDLK